MLTELCRALYFNNLLEQNAYRIYYYNKKKKVIIIKYNNMCTQLVCTYYNYTITNIN